MAAILSLPEALEAVRRALFVEFGCRALRVQIFTTEGVEPICLPFPSADALAKGDGVPFVLTPFQNAILAALEGKALRTDALGAAVGDRSRLYRPGGLQELRERGLVLHHPRMGFYRPDAPPPQLPQLQESGK